MSGPAGSPTSIIRMRLRTSTPPQLPWKVSSWWFRTPPPQAIRTPSSRSSTSDGHTFISKAKRLIYIELPEEDWEEGHEGKCWVLEYSLYGTWEAAHNCEEEFGSLLTSAGLKRGRASPCLYTKFGGRLSAAVHGDDVTVQGSKAAVLALIASFRKRDEIKVQIIGEGFDKEAAVLNRKITWSPEGVWWEADTRHAQEIIKALNLEKATPVTTPATAGKEEDRQKYKQESLRKWVVDDWKAT